VPKTVYNSNNNDDDDDDNNKDIIILLCDWRSPLGWSGRELYKSLFVGRGKELGQEIAARNETFVHHIVWYSGVI